MTRGKANYDVHNAYNIYSLANKSAMYWPTYNCSKPLTQSTVTALMMNLAAWTTSDINKRQRVICDELEIIHDGGSDVRVSIDNEALANESVGRIIKPGEVFNPPIRVHNFLVFYTSSNVSQAMRINVGGYV